MRTYLRLTVLAASAVVIASPMIPADAATGHVLTIGKAGGTAVKTGAVLKSGLAKGTSAVFSLGTEKLTCKAGALSAKVVTNPVKPGTATESLTAQSFSKCTINVSGVTFKSLKALNLPYKVSVSDAAGDPVKVTGQSSSKPVAFTAVATAGTLTVTCTYKASTVTGHASNTGNKISFSKQKFTFASGNTIACPKSANFTATLGPVTDSSVSGSPKVFVN